MKAIPIITLFAMLALTLPSLAAKKHKGGAGQGAAPPSAAPPAAGQLPSEQVSTFAGALLDSILAPLGKGSLPVQTRTQLTQFDQQLRSEASKAPAEKQVIHQRALAVTGALATIMDEREKQVIAFRNSHTKRPMAALAPKVTENERKRARTEASSEKNFFTASEEQHWTQVSATYRQQIQSLIEQVRIAERQISAQPASLVPGNK